MLTYSYNTNLPPKSAISHILLKPMGSRAKPLGRAVPATARNVVTIPRATIALKPPIAQKVEQATHKTAVIRAANGFVTAMRNTKI